MKTARNYIIVLFCLTTFINLLIFFYRERFAYHKYGTYSSLYSSDVSKWKKFIYDYPKQELIEANTILDSLNIKDQSTAFKILEIGKLLYNHFHDQIGQPSAQLLTISPLNQYKVLSSSDSIRLWCGNFASILAFFCWSKGITCRVIEINNPGDHHVLNECYLTETNEWVITDVTNNQLLLLNKNKNRYVNLLNLRDSLPDTLLSAQVAGDSIISKSFNTGFYDHYFGDKNPINYYYRVNNIEVYKTSEKIKRYFFPVAWYEEINKTPKGNLPFYIKQLFILLWLICLILLIKQTIFPKIRLQL
ncbi:MAG TPA: transglutaminase domain-containing protein [Chitinophagaceae bacterium]|jgi:hypothetical protein|nr:transglutaminase domain-containing protein [Chitinophagaceae bacterium]